jgi:hypothetical protein
MLCARPGCDEEEDRIDGYCSVYCRDVAEQYDEVSRLIDIIRRAMSIISINCSKANCEQKLFNEIKCADCMHYQIIMDMREALGLRNHYNSPTCKSCAFLEDCVSGKYDDCIGWGQRK